MKEKKSQRGRPKLPAGEKAARKLNIRCHDYELEIWRKTADAQNMTMGAWVRNILNNNLIKSIDI